MKSIFEIALIEDSISLTKAIEEYLNNRYADQIVIFHFVDVGDALSYDGLNPKVILLDHHLKGAKGVDSIPLLKQKFFDAEIAVMSSQNDMNVLKEAYEYGAEDYIRKDALFFYNMMAFVEERISL